MGMCLEEFGRVSVEVRRESFIIHAGYDIDGSPALYRAWVDEPHPEFLLEDLDNLIKALKDAGYERGLSEVNSHDWLTALSKEKETDTHPCDNHPSFSCMCKGACSCHFIQDGIEPEVKK